jgi:VRR-NUC domain-containing protein
MRLKPTRAEDRVGVMRPPLDWVNRRITEAELQAAILGLAKVFGWEAYHPKFSWRSRRGYPDLTLWHPVEGSVVWVELKKESGKVTPEQTDTHTSMRAAGLTVFVWRPSDWATAVEFLSFGRATG